MRATAKQKRSVKRRLWIAGLLFWAAFSSFLALPSFNSSRSNEEIIADLNARIGELSRWTSVAAAPDSSLALWRDRQDLRFNALFPRKQDVEQLYHHLALSARRCGIDPIHLKMKEQPSRRRRSPKADKDKYVLPGPDTELMRQISINPGSFPSSKLQANVLQLQFNANFSQLIEYLEDLRQMPRALNVISLDLKESFARVKVDLELEYYVQSTR
jgi:hypothetical protein